MCFDPFSAAAMGGGAGVCLLWNGRRLFHQGAHDSDNWAEATLIEIEDILHYSRLVQGAYASTLEKVQKRVGFIDPSCIVEFSSLSMGKFEDAMCPPHYTYIDHVRKEIAVCIRGMRLNNTADYKTLLSNRRGAQSYRDGFVHRGILEASKWLSDYCRATWSNLLHSYLEYDFVVVGHSLGAGIASILALMLLYESHAILGVPSDRVKCYAFAPPRVMSLNLAVESARIIHSVVLQDDFWPRTSTSVIAKLFASALCCLQFIIFSRMVKDIFISDKRRLKDCKRLYPPGMLYHIVCKKKYKCATIPFQVLKANPEGGRFEKVIITWRAMGDHHIKNYEVALLEAYEECIIINDAPFCIRKDVSNESFADMEEFDPRKSH